MDITTAIIGLAMLSLFVIPAIILSAKNKKRNNALLIGLKKFAAERNCELSAHDVQPLFAIGIATSGDQAFFIRRQDETDELIRSSHQMAMTKACDLQVEKRAVKLLKSDETVIDKIEICFYSNNKEERNVRWTLYDSAISPQTDNEFILGEKWVSIIRKAI